MKNLYKIIVTVIAVLLFVACKKDNDTPGTVVLPPQEAPKSSLKFMFDLRGKEATTGVMIDLDLTKEYLTPEGDTLSISEFKMYLSEFTLVKENGDEVSLGEKYYLLSQTLSDNNFQTIKTAKGIPAGTYKSLRFSIGVPDQCNTVDPCSTGDLDPYNSKSTGMIWNWSTNSGYKFLKFEAELKGNNTSGSGATNGAVSIHVATAANFKTVTLTSDPIVIEDEKETSIHLMGMIPQLFAVPNTIDLEEPVDKSEVSANYADGFFMIHHVMNPTE